VAIKSALRPMSSLVTSTTSYLASCWPGGLGQNPARQTAIRAGIAREKTAFGINQVCGSGLRAIALGTQQIATGDAPVVVAGG